MSSIGRSDSGPSPAEANAHGEPRRLAGRAVGVTAGLWGAARPRAGLGPLAGSRQRAPVSRGERRDGAAPGRRSPALPGPQKRGGREAFCGQAESRPAQVCSQRPGGKDDCCGNSGTDGKAGGREAALLFLKTTYIHKALKDYALTENVTCCKKT